MKRQFYYFVHDTADPSSKVIWHGKNGDLCKEFCITPHELSDIFKTSAKLLYEERYVERKYLDTVSKDILRDANKLKVKKKRKSKFEQNIQMLEKMLDIYGNTIVWKDFEKVEARLNKDGYFIKAKYEPERRIRYLKMGSGNGAYEIFDECWVIELVRKESINNDIY